MVHSAAGGVGGALVQLGKRCGCKVIGVVDASQKIKPLKTTTYPFESVAEAHRALESGETIGKLVLELK